MVLLYPSLSPARHLTTVEVINNAYKEGEISYQKALNYKAFAIFRPERLPDYYRSKFPMKSGTPLLMEIRANRHLLSSENARYLARGRIDTLATYYGNGIELKSYVSGGEHFRIHYTTDDRDGDAVPQEDNNGNSIPDYVEKMAEFLEYAWEEEMGILGYDAPPSDGAEGGDCLLDVYLADIASSSGYGITMVDEGMPTSTVYIILDNDFLPLCKGNSSGICFPSDLNPDGPQEGAMKVAAAHELFHTIQFQISDDIDQYGWLMEASATWMEDQVFPEVKDYVNYIGDWFDNPHVSINTFNGIFEYGTAVWLKHITEKYGSAFIYDVWDRIRNKESAIDAIEAELLERGDILSRELKELRVANITFTHNDGLIYRTWEGDPASVPLNSITFNKTIEGNINPLASRYYTLSSKTDTGTISIEFTGDSDMSAIVIGMAQDLSLYDVTEIVPDSSGHGSIIVKGPGNNGSYEQVIIIVINGSTSAAGMFTLLVTPDPSAVGTISKITITPVDSSIIASEILGATNMRTKVMGRRQYFIEMRDSTGSQLLERGLIWSSDLPASSVIINPNGFLLTADNVSGGTRVNVAATFNSLSDNAVLDIKDSEGRGPGTSRGCSISGSDSRCFIATAAYGSPLDPYVKILRTFRDRYLLTNPAGRYIVSLYYYYSPPAAEKIKDHAYLRETVKIFLIPAIMFSWIMIKTSMVEKILLVMFVLIGISFVIKGSKIRNIVSGQSPETQGNNNLSSR